MKNYFLEKGFNLFASKLVSEIPDHLYSFSENQKSKTLCLLGSGGNLLWEKLPTKDGTHPIDDYTKKTILNQYPQAEILFPNNDQTLPLQQLGRHLNLAQPSAMAIDISAEFGLWFAYRAVFLIDEKVTNVPLSFNSPCDFCHEKKCLEVDNINQSRLKCPVKIEHTYSKEQQAYHLKVLQYLTHKKC